MATMRRGESKAAVSQQRAAVRRGAAGKRFVGDDTGSVAGRAAELARVQQFREELGRSREREPRVEAPVSALLTELLADSLRLARTVVLLPFRVAVALRGARARGAEA